MIHGYETLHQRYVLLSLVTQACPLHMRNSTGFSFQAKVILRYALSFFAVCTWRSEVLPKASSKVSADVLPGMMFLGRSMCPDAYALMEHMFLTLRQAAESKLLVFQ